MPSFRSPKDQAQWAAAQLAGHGQPRSQTRYTAAVSSVGTQRGYAQALRGFQAWLAPANADLRTATAEQARQYLAERAQSVAQGTLDSDRKAVTAWYQHRDGQRPDLARAEHQSQVEGRGLAQESRVYTAEQVREIQAHQTDRHAIATEVAAEAGLRSHELASIARLEDRPEASERDWRGDRFVADHRSERYTVVGKGGLTREVRLTPVTAARLEGYRRPEPVRVSDRGAHYTSRYDIGYGQRWAQSYSAASRQALGWSRGAHSLRHTYAQQRMEQLQSRQYSYDQAREVVAQEVGHFRSSTTEAYLR